MNVSIYQTEKIKKFLPQLREFVVNELYPRESVFLHKSFREAEPTLNELRAKVKSLGWWAPHLPEELGGMGFSLLEFAHISEVLGSCPMGHYVFGSQAPDIGNTELILHAGTEDQKIEFLMPLIKGEIRSCFSMTEPDTPGSNPINLNTTAIKEGNNYVINGRKWFTSSFDGAKFAIAMVATDPDNPSPHRRASMLIVPTDAPGLKFVRNVSIMGSPHDGWPSHAELEYENVKVPMENLLGAEGEGFALAQIRLGPGRIHHCMRWIGIAERALDLMCQRAVSRELMPGVNIASKQTIQNYIAEARANINAARLMVLNTAMMIDEAGSKTARAEISMIKYFCSKILLEVIDNAIQVHGALGMTDDTVLSFWYRHERASKIYDGPDEVHKSVVAKRELSKYGAKVEA
jgi:alkylation response protein AidB-like acyl-CoA dehydrogenase